MVSYPSHITLGGQVLRTNEASNAIEFRPFLQEASEKFAAEYAAAAERATTSARLLRELIRRTRQGIEDLRTTYDKEITERRQIEQSRAIEPATKIRDAAYAKADSFIQQEMALIVEVLGIQFQHAQDMVTELEEYRACCAACTGDGDSMYL